MSNQSPLRPEDYYPDRSDEIDLTELMAHAWATRWRVVGAVALAVALYLAYLAVSMLLESEPVTHTHIFELDFEGLEEGEYPDGSPFELTSIVSQTVLNRVHARQNLLDYGLSVGDLRQALSIEPYSATFPLIRARYRQRLSDDNLSSEDREAIEAEMREALSVERAGSVRLGLQLPVDVGLSKGHVEAVLKDIPRTWAERAITEQGVLDLNRTIYSGQIFDPARFSELDYPVAVDLLQENIELLREDIAALESVPHATNVSDPETGLRLLDLDKVLADTLEYDLRRLIDPVRELGLTRDAETAALYLSRQLREARLEQRASQARARLARQLINTGLSDQRAAGASGADDRDNGSVGLSAQIDSSFLDRLTEISRQGDGQDFRQSLMRQILEHEEAALVQRQTAERVQRSLEAIQGEVEEVPEAVMETYTQRLEERLPQAPETLQAHAETLQRISEQIALEAPGNTSELITPVGGSFEINQAALIPERAPMILALIVFLVGFAAMIVSMLVDAMRRRTDLVPAD